MTQAQREIATGLILALGEFPAGAPDPSIEIIDLDAAAEAALRAPGVKKISEQGVVIVTPPPPPAVVFGGSLRPTPHVQTVGVAPAELFRATLATMTAYTALVDLLGVDNGNGNVRHIRATVVVKRLAGGAIIVPITGGALFTLLADHRDGTAAAWTITPSVAGGDFLLTVVGAAGRTVDWFARLSIDSFTPAGA